MESPELRSIEDKIWEVYSNPRVIDALVIIERVLACNEFIRAQKRFRGVIKQDPYSLDLEFNYRPDLLWIHSAQKTHGRWVTSFAWNPENLNVLAASYGPQENNELRDGWVLIWGMKNPRQPGRAFNFESPVSALSWSKKHPNFLAVGLFDGNVHVIDVRSRNLAIIKSSSRKSTPSFTPHWNVRLIILFDILRISRLLVGCVVISLYLTTIPILNSSPQNLLFKTPISKF